MEELVLDVSCNIIMELTSPYFQTLFELKDFKFRFRSAEDIVCNVFNKEISAITSVIKAKVKTFNYL
jgi:hypothetical protein